VGTRDDITYTWFYSDGVRDILLPIQLCKMSNKRVRRNKVSK